MCIVHPLRCRFYLVFLIHFVFLYCFCWFSLIFLFIINNKIKPFVRYLAKHTKIIFYFSFSNKYPYEKIGLICLKLGNRISFVLVESYTRKQFQNRISEDIFEEFIRLLVDIFFYYIIMIFGSFVFRIQTNFIR